MAAATDVIRLNEFDTYALLPLQSRGAGTYIKNLVIVGNSLLSTVFVKSISGSVKVNYYEFTTGRDSSERKELPGHLLITAPNTANPSKITTTPFHNTVVLEVIVTGTAEFSVYTTVVSSFATDLDAALHLEGDVVDVLEDKGLPGMCFNRTTGRFEFLSCPLNVTIIEQEPFFSRGAITVVPGTTQTMLSFTVPNGTTRKLRRVFVTGSNDGYFTLESGGVEIAAGIIDNTNRNTPFIFDPQRPIGAGTLVELKFISESEPSLGCPATGFISAEDFT